MDQIWLTSPSPAMRLWSGTSGASWRLNPAALAWAGSVGLEESAWATVASELSMAHGVRTSSAEGRLVAAELRWWSLPMDTGWLVWLVPDHDALPANVDLSLRFAPEGDSTGAARPRGGSEGTTDAWGSLVDKLELVQDFGRMGLFERDCRTGKGRWDRHMFRLFGFDPARGIPDWSVALTRIHPDDAERFVTEHERFVREPGRHSVRYRVVTPDGTQRDLHAFFEVRLGADGQPALMIGAVFDDTESAGRIRDQLVINAQLAEALRLAQIAVWRVDLPRQWIDLNDVGYGMLGMAPVAEGVPLDMIRRLAHPDDAAALARAAEEALATNVAIDLETRYAHATGYRHMLTRRVAKRDEHGRAIGLLGVSLDQTERITERDRAQALAQRMEMVADIAGLGVFTIDVMTTETEWNRQMFQIHGVPEGAPVPNFEWLAGQAVHPDDRFEFVRRRQLSLDSAGTRFDGEVRIVHPDGSIRWIEYRSRREQFDGRALIFGIVLDVTERVTQRVAAERSKREKEAAEQANAARSEFLARMSHELRTPLNAVLGFAQLIEHEGETVPFAMQLERVAHIRQAGDKLLALVGDVFDQVVNERLTDPGALSANPASQGASSTLATSPATAGNALKVLYIEDNPVNVILVEELVAMRANTSLHCAEDGLSGVAWAEAGRPDVVLVDMQLPDIDGFEVLRRLRAMRSLDRSAIIALSANGMTEDIAAARAAGFDDYWTKPIDFRHFLSGLDRLAAAR